MAAAARRIAALTRVLAVDDDPQVCDLIGDMMDDAAFQLDCVRTDKEALKRLNADDYKALIVDINLGAGVTGFDLARHARRLNPAIAVVYVTGQATKSSFEAFGVRGAVLVEKPFTAESLLRAVDQALGARR